MSNVFQTEILEIDGIELQVEYETDLFMGEPWEECDVHGPVRRARNARDKKPGEVVLWEGGYRGYTYIYDYQSAIETAKREGWGCEEVTPEDTPGQRALKAVNADIRYLQGWCSNTWVYCMVNVSIVGGADEFSDCLGGIETYKNYHKEMAQEMAEHLVARYKKELAEREYWDARGVVTL